MGIWGKSRNAWGVAICVGLIAACNVFGNETFVDDAGRKKDTRVKDASEPMKAAEEGGNGGPDDGGGGDSGQSTVLSPRDVGGGGGRTGLGGSSGNRPASCGDGLIGTGELCDVALTKAGACPQVPEDCPPIDPNCGSWIIKGDGCQTECVKTEVACKNGDGCCPSACSYVNDSDCSSQCGDGIVQKDKRELCDIALNGRSAPEGGPSCPTKCQANEEESKLCIKRVLSGSAANCNAECKPAPITALISGDKCCPNGANSNTDSDCPTRCGNNIREANEECDGTANCDEQCKNRLNDAQQKCMKDYDWSDSSEECAKCACSNCLTETTNCYGNKSDARAVGCSRIVLCAYQKGCIAEACYCGDFSGLNLILWCPTLANGPCKSVIDDVAGTSVLSEIMSLQGQPDSALGRAEAISNCYDTQCKSVCSQ
jgi:hypothetical protein